MTAISSDRLEANWRAITAELDAPRRGRLERLLLLARIPESVARLLVSTPALRRAWFIATGVALFFGLSAADTRKPDASLWPLLVLAPLVPVIGVALAYGPSADPAYEATVATPMSGLRVVLTRTAAIVSTTIVLAGLATLLLRDKTAMAAAWLIPSAALPLVVLALATVMPLRRSSIVVGAVWLGGLALVRNRFDDELAVFRTAGQVAFLCCGLAAGAVLVLRRERFERLVSP